MTPREKSIASFSLAGLIIVCATILAGLHVFTAELALLAFSTALGGVGWYHAAAPGQGTVAEPDGPGTTGRPPA